MDNFAKDLEADIQARWISFMQEEWAKPLMQLSKSLEKLRNSGTLFSLFIGPESRLKIINKGDLSEGLGNDITIRPPSIPSPMGGGYHLSPQVGLVFSKHPENGNTLLHVDFPTDNKKPANFGSMIMMSPGYDLTSESEVADLEKQLKNYAATLMALYAGVTTLNKKPDGTSPPVTPRVDPADRTTDGHVYLPDALTDGDYFEDFEDLVQEKYKKFRQSDIGNAVGFIVDCLSALNNAGGKNTVVFNVPTQLQHILDAMVENNGFNGDFIVAPFIMVGGVLIPANLSQQAGVVTYNVAFTGDSQNLKSYIISSQEGRKQFMADLYEFAISAHAALGIGNPSAGENDFDPFFSVDRDDEAARNAARYRFPKHAI